MANHGFVKTFEEGLQKVLDGGFALLHDSVAADQYVAANPGKLDNTKTFLTQFIALGKVSFYFDRPKSIPYRAMVF